MTMKSVRPFNNALFQSTDTPTGCWVLVAVGCSTSPQSKVCGFSQSVSSTRAERIDARIKSINWALPHLYNCTPSQILFTFCLVEKGVCRRSQLSSSVELVCVCLSATPP